MLMKLTPGGNPISNILSKKSKLDLKYLNGALFKLRVILSIKII